jgi:hypothetical protein
MGYFPLEVLFLEGGPFVLSTKQRTAFHSVLSRASQKEQSVHLARDGGRVSSAPTATCHIGAGGSSGYPNTNFNTFYGCDMNLPNCPQPLI